MSDHGQTHRLDIGTVGCATVRLTFSSDIIAAVVEVPAGLNRRNRRMVNRWATAIFRKLDTDSRGMRIVATCNGRLMSIGAEYQGKGVVFSS